MHNFDELISRSTSFTLNALNDLHNNIEEKFQSNGSTETVKNLQMIQLQKAIIAIGMFSLFESILQEGLACKNGFNKAKIILNKSGKVELLDRFNYFIAAINVLKHGRGKSYDTLVKSESLPFRIKLPGESFYSEGDVSEVSTLVNVDDKFVLNCAELIEQVFKEIKKDYPIFS